MFVSDTSTKYYKEIPLSGILAINPSGKGNSYCFELKTQNLDYFCGEDFEAAIGWELAVRQAYMPVNGAMETGKSVTFAKGVTGGLGGPSVQELRNQHQAEDADISQQYQIFPDEVLGSGQFGIVYGGVHRTSGRAVAIKVIDKLRFPTKQEAQLKNEVSEDANWQRPSIVV